MGGEDSGAALLERDGALSVLQAAFGGVVAGQGAVVLVSGEAGIGKTSLVRAFVAAGNAYTPGISPEIAEELIDKTRVMGAYQPSTLIDFLRGFPIELDALFFEPLRRAQSRAVPVPRLEALCDILKSLANDERPL